ncbi:CLUMA_CG002036, isoform A [Clunio marinus]|uniref:CLUMA_CG002036, isoform A n=1 Tax=Clunio marinus TaxID=568069 RepID=A0A1J1HJL9_9DIPT|nr:CLUMA_CG002036, isoform A [Clunio marinus]
MKTSASNNFMNRLYTHQNRIYYQLLSTLGCYSRSRFLNRSLSFVMIFFSSSA